MNTHNYCHIALHKFSVMPKSALMPSSTAKQACSAVLPMAVLNIEKSGLARRQTPA
jgi:hypothetical protein